MKTILIVGGLGAVAWYFFRVRGASAGGPRNDSASIDPLVDVGCVDCNFDASTEPVGAKNRSDILSLGKFGGESSAAPWMRSEDFLAGGRL